MTDALGRVGPSTASRARQFTERTVTLMIAGLGAVLLVSIVVAAALLGGYGISPDFSARLSGPSLYHWFGTDQFGRDMLARTIHGLNVSLWVGLFSAGLSTAIAATLALVAATGGKWADSSVTFLVDVTMGLPHLVLLILISFALGGGTSAVVTAVAVTHWPRLTRVLRAELLQLRSSGYVMASRRFGKSWWYIGRHHLLPHLVPQIIVGFLLLLPHAILHEAALTFIGFGLEPGRPAIGVLLSDSMRYLMAGRWWLGLFPGLCLLLLVLCFDAIGNGVRALCDPRQTHQ